MDHKVEAKAGTMMSSHENVFRIIDPLWVELVDSLHKTCNVNSVVSMLLARTNGWTNNQVVGWSETSWRSYDLTVMTWYIFIGALNNRISHKSDIFGGAGQALCMLAGSA